MTERHCPRNTILVRVNIGESIKIFITIRLCDRPLPLKESLEVISCM